MPLDPQRVAETAAWLVKAAGDLRAAHVLLAAPPGLTGEVVFHCQQAAEKALKAFLVWHDIPFRKTHDLGEVGGQCLKVDPTLEAICREADALTVYAWAFRYPGEPVDPPEDETRDALALAQRLVAAVRSRLPDVP